MVVLAGPGWGQTPAPTGPSPLVGFGAAAGAALGMLGGYAAGRGLADRFRIDQTGDDPGLSVAVGGAVLGSLVGSAVGAHVAGGSTPTQPAPSFGRRMRDAGAGLLVGAALGYLGARLTEPHGRTGWIVGMSVGEGLYAGLSDGRW